MPALLATAALAAGFALQPTGAFHGDEPVARDGEHWLALATTSDGAQALVASRVAMRRVHDPIADADHGPPTGLDVSAEQSPEASMLLRGPGLRPGTIEAGRILLPPADAAATEIGTFAFRGTTWRLHARCRPSPHAASDAQEAQACDLVLQNGLAQQVLMAMRRVRQDDGSWSFGDDAAPSLLHAGDFDRDGRPDLILDTRDHYNVSRPTLFLSGEARGGELVRRVAGYTSVGC